MPYIADPTDELTAAIATKADIASPTFTGTATTPAIKITTGASLGKVLTSAADGAATWETPAAVGVTSVAMTVPTGFSVTGSPVTSTGTLAVSTTLSGVLKGTGSGIAAATAGTDYVVGSGLAGGQITYGGTGSAENYTIYSTSNPTKGLLYLNHPNVAVAANGTFWFVYGSYYCTQAGVMNVARLDFGAGLNKIERLGTGGLEISAQNVSGAHIVLTTPQGYVTLSAPDAADDAAAAALTPAVPVGGLYRSGSDLKVRVGTGNTGKPAYAGIYVYDGVTAQTIATGSTPTILTCFNTATGFDGVSTNATPTKASNKITLTLAGTYLVNYSFSYKASVNNITLEMYVFSGGTVVASTGSQTKSGVANDIQCISGVGYVTVAANTDLTLRGYHDQGGNVDITPTHVNFTATKVND